MWETIFRHLKKFLFPRAECVLCDEEIGRFDHEFLCESCYKELPRNYKACAFCGRQLLGISKVCTTCRKRTYDFKRAYAPFVYKDGVAKLVKEFKYNDLRCLKEFFALEMYNYMIENELTADYLAYVPMTKDRLIKRGYNQGYLLAKEISKRSNIPVGRGIIKTRRTKRQAKLNSRQRSKNLVNAFKVDRKMFRGKSVLLVDDIFTTGTTCNTISKLLYKAGATEVNVLLIAQTPEKLLLMNKRFRKSLDEIITDKIVLS